MTELPHTGAPAARALLGAGYTTLESVADVPDDELLALHGVGPEAIRIIRAALDEQP